jgi:hypothetical protein
VRSRRTRFERDGRALLIVTARAHPRAALREVEGPRRAAPGGAGGKWATVERLIASTHSKFSLAKETIRRLQIEAGLWIPRRLRLPKIQQPRARREGVGELVQMARRCRGTRRIFVE